MPAPFRAVALSDLSNTVWPHSGRIARELISRLSSSNDAVRPLFAFLHWGAEFQRDATPRQLEVLDRLGESPVSAVFGAHPHVASPGPELWRNGDGLVSLSLGNFLFDQQNGSAPSSSCVFSRTELSPRAGSRSAICFTLRSLNDVALCPRKIPRHEKMHATWRRENFATIDCGQPNAETLITGSFACDLQRETIIRAGRDTSFVIERNKVILALLL